MGYACKHPQTKKMHDDMEQARQRTRPFVTVLQEMFSPHHVNEHPTDTTDLEGVEDESTVYEADDDSESDSTLRPPTAPSDAPITEGETDFHPRERDLSWAGFSQNTATDETLHEERTQAQAQTTPLSNTAVKNRPNGKKGQVRPLTGSRKRKNAQPSDGIDTSAQVETTIVTPTQSIQRKRAKHVSDVASSSVDSDIVGDWTEDTQSERPRGLRRQSRKNYTIPPLKFDGQEAVPKKRQPAKRGRPSRLHHPRRSQAPPSPPSSDASPQSSNPVVSGHFFVLACSFITLPRHAVVSSGFYNAPDSS